jgi:DNA-binding IclR family transcriptional regulator
MVKKITPADTRHQTLARALQILEVFSMERPEWGIRELGRELGINLATVLRLVTTLQQAGYLERNPKTQRYALGSTVVKLASLYTYHNPLPKVGRKVFESYADRFEHNFYLGTLRQYEVVYLAVLDGRGPLTVQMTPGGTIALHTTALGKVLLAFQSDEFIQRFIKEHDLQLYSARSITNPDLLWAQIQDIRRQGVAINNGEHFDDIAAVGAPVYDQLGQVMAGVSLAFPRFLISEQRLSAEDLIPLVRQIAAEITEYAGGKLPTETASYRYLFT